jgi:hypothetical protein
MPAKKSRRHSRVGAGECRDPGSALRKSGVI